MLLDAPALRHAARLLTVDADWLVGQAEWLSRNVDDLPATGFRGAAAEAAVGRLHLLARPMAGPPAQMLRVAQVLTMTAGLQEELDAAGERARGLAAGYAGAADALSVLLLNLRALGDLLDHACARQIDLLCTPVPTEEPTRLGDTPDLDVAAVHELNLITAPAAVQQLALEHPDCSSWRWPTADWWPRWVISPRRIQWRRSWRGWDPPIRQGCRSTWTGRAPSPPLPAGLRCCGSATAPRRRPPMPWHRNRPGRRGRSCRPSNGS